MPIFQLTDSHLFPHPSLAEDNGLLAVGGDLSIERLLAAYSQGIFPWYSEGEPPLWWFTDPRLVIFPEEFKVSKRLARTLRNINFHITFNRNFERVITSCANTRTENGEETWINKDMQGPTANSTVQDMPTRWNAGKKIPWRADCTVCVWEISLANPCSPGSVTDQKQHS